MKALFFVLLLGLLPFVMLAQNEFEPNDNIAQPADIMVNETYVAYIQEANDKDYYRFTLPAAGMIIFRLISSPENVNVQYFLYDEFNQEIADFPVIAPNSTYLVENTLCAPTEYTIYLRDGGLGASQGSAFNAEVPYSFQVTFIPFTELDPCECENENIGQACPIDFNTPLQAMINPPFAETGNNPRDVDVYELNVEEPGALQLFVSSGPDNVDIEATFLDENGTEIFSRSGSVGEPMNLEISVCTPGTYYLEIKDGDSGLNNGWNTEDPYLFRVDFTPFSETELCECEPGLVNSQCTIMACDSIFGTISAIGGPDSGFEDEDTYLVDLAAETEVSVAVLRSPAELSTKLTIEDPTGGSVKQHTLSPGETDFFTFTTSSSGVYTIKMEANLTLDWSVDDPYLIQVGCNLVSTEGYLPFENDVTVSPNPARDFVSIMGISGTYDYQLRNMDGRMLKAGFSSGQRLELPDDLAPGIYLLTLTQKGRRVSKRLVIH